MLQYKIEEMNLRTALKACLLIGCAGVINYIFERFLPEVQEEEEKNDKT